MDAKAIVFGLTFKENCNDLRNSKVYDVIEILKNSGTRVSVHDPLGDKGKINIIYKTLTFENIDNLGKYDIVILAVPHKYYRKKGASFFNNLVYNDGMFLDLKGCFDKKLSDFRL